MLSPFLFAASFLTRVPLPPSVHTPSPRTLARGPLWFPFVGALIGLATGAIALCLARALPVWPSVIIALIFEARLTGAMHEDALADCADAFGGGWTKERVFEIFKDSRLGTYGVLALILGVSLRASLMGALLAGPSLAFIAATSLAACAGRFMMLAFLKAVPPVPERASLSKDFAANMSWTDVLFSGLPLIGLAYLAQSVSGLAIGVGMCAALFVFAKQSVIERLGGSTGDVLGAIAFVGQVLLLIGLTTQL